ncbi:MAG TPA: hypothetical protein VGT06_10905 [Candidatus Methylomirabilis sp.]|nr:hypothetical protein [Candidatus Methylomirabilis sp.]
MNIKKLAMAAGVCAVAVLMGVPSVEAQFSLFGSATEVIGGIGNTRAVELTSRCTFTGSPPSCDTSGPTFTFSGVNFQSFTPLTFAGISQLSADFNVGATDCGGGSPRFQINIDIDGDGVSDGNVFVYLGPSPNFTGCLFGWQSTGNLIGNTDAGRYDATQFAASGGQLGTYAQAVAALGNFPVVGIQLVVDSGWFTGPRGQAIQVDNIRINTTVLK